MEGGSMHDKKLPVDYSFLGAATTTQHVSTTFQGVNGGSEGVAIGT